MTGRINNAAFFRRDVAEGRNSLPVTLAMTIVNAAAGCAAVSGPTWKSGSATLRATAHDCTATITLGVSV